MRDDLNARGIIKILMQRFQESDLQQARIYKALALKVSHQLATDNS